MKTIIPAKVSISQLWGYPKPKDTVYRLMKYLLEVEVEDGILLHNAVTRQMILLSNDEKELLSKLPAKPTEEMQELIKNHFLVPVDFDEYRSVNQLRKIYQSRSSSGSINHYVILPTTYCNAHCFYCYESDFPHVHMTSETAQKIIDYIDEHRNGQEVRLDWFGGEPLVGVKRIDQITQGLKDRGVPFTSSMISNAILFDEEIVEKAIDLWKLKRVQITLDGTEGVYNKVKAYVGIKGSPFQRVLNNIDLLTKNKVRVIIRLNVDFYNKDDIYELIEKLGERYSGNQFITVYQSMLFNNQGFEPVQHSQEDIMELLNIIDQYSERMKALGIAHETITVPSLQIKQCMADSPNTIEIQPDGSFCRCEHENLNDSYGNLDEGILDPQKPQEWKETIERADYCPECCVYPNCYLLRHCMSADNPCFESYRARNLKKHKEQLRTVYLKSLEGTKNEGVH